MKLICLHCQVSSSLLHKFWGGYGVVGCFYVLGWFFGSGVYSMAELRCGDGQHHAWRCRPASATRCVRNPYHAML
jgi:hypothetical protein